MSSVKSPAAIAEELGKRLTQARLNVDMTQAEVAQQAGVSRKTVLSAEKGKVQLENLIAIMEVIGLTSQLDSFIPVQEISPIQLAKLQGQKRQRATGTSGRRFSAEKPSTKKEASEW